MSVHPGRFMTAAALLSAMLAAAPLTAVADEAPRVMVNTSDLNLGTAAGRTVLRNRIDLAVGKVCDPVHGRTPWEVRAYATCTKTARAGATSQYEAMVANTGKKLAAEH